MTTILYGNEARKVLLRGIKKVCDPVSSTLGPNASTALFKAGDGRPIVVDDGVSIIRQIKLDDPLEELGAALVREVAEEAQKASGDGTTSAMVMALAMAEKAYEQVVNLPFNPQLQKVHMEATVERAIKLLGQTDVRSQINTIERLTDVATLAANGDRELGLIIAQAFDSVGEGGAVFVKDGLTDSPKLDIIQGMKIEAGAATPYLLLGKKQLRLDDCLVAVTDEIINDFSELVQGLNVSVEEKKPLVIFCAEISQAALDSLALNVVQGKVRAMVVKLPGMGSSTYHTAQDIAIRSGAKCLSTSLGERIRDIEESHIGSVNGIFTDNSTVLVPLLSETDKRVEEREEELLEEMGKAEHEWDRKVLQVRISNLQGRVATITVCADTDTETIEMKTRMDDSINATRAALKGGVIAGGGQALNKIAKHLEEHAASDIVIAGMRAVGDTLTQNAGLDDRNEWFAGLLGKKEIIDPFLVVENSLRAAASIAGLVLTTDLLIAGE